MQKITENIYYVGVNDRNKSLFEGLWPLPYGVSYNSYLIDDEKVCLIDTVEVDFFTQYIEHIQEVIGERKVDYLVINHMEPDHSGSIALIKKYYPNIQIVGNKKTFQMMEGFYGVKEGLLEVKNGDSILIRTKDAETGEEGESIENPTSQARGYVYKMRSKIRQKTGKTPLVYDMVAFPNLSKDDFDSKGIETVCEFESTILREDLDSKKSFYEKMNLGIKNHKGALSHCADFTPELMYRVRQIFETDLNIEDTILKIFFLKCTNGKQFFLHCNKL